MSHQKFKWSYNKINNVVPDQQIKEHERIYGKEKAKRNKICITS